MDAHSDDLLPFYLNRTLNAADQARLETHLAACPACRERLARWEKLSLAVGQAAHSRLPERVGQAATLPALSPLVYAGLQRRPSLPQALLSAANLIWAQRVFLVHGRLELALGSLGFLGGLAWLIAQGAAGEWGGFLLFAAAPLAAALSTAFLYTFEDDPAGEMVAAAPTPPGTLAFARLTLALGVIGLLALLGSLLLAVMGQPPRSFFELVAVWLGPMLLLSALTTVLSLCLHPRAACGAALLAWGSVIVLLLGGQAVTPVLRSAFVGLLNPSWLLLAGQVLLAGLLWLVNWVWLAGHAPAWLRSE